MIVAAVITFKQLQIDPKKKIQGFKGKRAHSLC